MLQVRKSRKAASGYQEEAEDSFFSLLEKADKNEVDLSERKSGSLFWYNLAIASMALVSIVLMFRKNR